MPTSTTSYPASRFTALAAGLAFLACGAAAPAAASAQSNAGAKPGSIDRRVAADPEGTVAIANVAGSVRIEAWERPEVHVGGTIGAGVERVDVLRDGARVVVKVVMPRGGSYSRGGTELQVKVPAASKLEVSSVSADVESRGVRGALRVNSVSGNVTLDFDAAPLEVKTVSGDVNLRGTGRAATSRVTTVSGDLRVERGAGSLEATTVSGDLALALEGLRSLRLRTTSGDVALRGAPERGASLEAESVSGDVGMTLRAAAGIELEAESFSGDIGTCFGARGTRSGMGPGSSLRATRGEGGARLRIKTMSGDIEVCDR